MKKIFTITLILSAWITQSQDIEFKAANFKDDKEGFKAAEDALKLGTEQYLLGNIELFAVRDAELYYRKALQSFDKAYKFNPNSSELNFKMGVCYANISEREKCVPLLKRAFELNPVIDPFMNYYYGLALELEGNYVKALEYFEKFEVEYNKADRFGKFVKQRKTECAAGKTLLASPVRAWVDHVPDLSTEFDDYSPTVTMDGEEILITSDRPNGHTPNEVGRYDDDIYASTLYDGKWQAPKPIRGPINTVKDDIVSNFHYSGNKMLMSKMNDAGNMDVYESFLTGADWIAPVGICREINLESNDIYASYDHNNKLIYYSKDKDGGTNGYDIMLAGVMNAKTRDYGMPTRENTVSSQFNDGPIYLHPDGKRMFICSEGFNSMGGFDIFMSTKVKGGGWTPPVNLGSPINTPYDDFFFAATANGKFAYISSNRPGGKGGYDIWKVIFWGPEKEPAYSVEDYLLASAGKPLSDVLPEEVQVTDAINLTVFKGITIDHLTKKPVEAVIDITNNVSGQIADQFTTNSATGKFLISLQSGGNYGIAVKASGYLFHSENFNIPEGSAYNLVNKTIELYNIKVGSKIALRNVFFDTGKSDIRPESNSELDRLVQLLKDVPTLKIELSGHTDNTGSASSNQTLSQSRAEAVVSYLVTKGIAKTRLVAKGYGQDRPVETNDTSDGRQNNRRTEFEITGN